MVWQKVWSWRLPVLLGALCLHWAMAEEEEEGSQGGVTMGVAMVGGVILVMGFWYLTHSLDMDIRQTSWSIISGTISIFLAVSIYQSCDGFFETVLNGQHEVHCQPGHKKECAAIKATEFDAKRVANQYWVCFWYGVMFCFMLWHAKIGPGGGLAKRREIEADREKFKQQSNFMQVDLLWAHTTGFAGIYGWGLVMNNEIQRNNGMFTFFHGIYNEDWEHEMVVVLLCFFKWFAILVGLGIMRKVIVHFCEKPKEGEKTKTDGKLLDLWEEKLRDGENDIYGVMVAFTLTMTLRFAIGGVLPNPKGEEEGESLWSHKAHESLVLYGIAFGFLFSSFFFSLGTTRKMMKLFFKKVVKKLCKVFQCFEEPLERFLFWFLEKTGVEAAVEKAVEAGAAAAELAAGPASKGAAQVKAETLKERVATLKKMLKKQLVQMCERIQEVLINVGSMTFSWTFMYATQWLIAGSGMTEAKGGSGEAQEEALKLLEFYKGNLSTSEANVQYDSLKDKLQEMQKDATKAKPDAAVLALLLAIFCTIASFIFIRVFDKIADAATARAKKQEEENAGLPLPSASEFGKALRTTILSFAFLVGFTWEAAFDQAVDFVSEAPYLKNFDVMGWDEYWTDICKFAICAWTGVLIFFGWKWFIVPMVEERGYEFGFVARTIKDRLNTQLEDMQGSERSRFHTRWMAAVYHLVQPLKCELEAEEEEIQKTITRVSSSQKNEGLGQPLLPSQEKEVKELKMRKQKEEELVRLLEEMEDKYLIKALHELEELEEEEEEEEKEEEEEEDAEE